MEKIQQRNINAKKEWTRDSSRYFKANNREYIQKDEVARKINISIRQIQQDTIIEDWEMESRKHRHIQNIRYERML